MNTSIWATETEIEAAGCGCPEFLENKRSWIGKMIQVLPFKRKFKTVSNGLVLGLHPYTNAVLIDIRTFNGLLYPKKRVVRFVKSVIP